MDFRDFLSLADALANGTTQAEWRTACSRGYYAAFHVARQLLLGLGFRVPQADRAHAYLWLRLSNAGVADMMEAGRRLNDLRRERNRTDYDEYRTITAAVATQNVRFAEEVIQALDAAAVEPVRTQVTDAMKVYERDVLHDVTWHPRGCQGGRRRAHDIACECVAALTANRRPLASVPCFPDPLVATALAATMP
jgi:uncharacterized protein (UPF0332 family)